MPNNVSVVANQRVCDPAVVDEDSKLVAEEAERIERTLDSWFDPSSEDDNKKADDKNEKESKIRRL